MEHKKSMFTPYRELTNVSIPAIIYGSNDEDKGGGDLEPQFIQRRSNNKAIYFLDSDDRDGGTWSNFVLDQHVSSNAIKRIRPTFFSMDKIPNVNQGNDTIIFRELTTPLVDRVAILSNGFFDPSNLAAFAVELAIALNAAAAASAFTVVVDLFMPNKLIWTDTNAIGVIFTGTGTMGQFGRSMMQLNGTPLAPTTASFTNVNLLWTNELIVLSNTLTKVQKLQNVSSGANFMTALFSVKLRKGDILPDTSFDIQLPRNIVFNFKRGILAHTDIRVTDEFGRDLDTLLQTDETDDDFSGEGRINITIELEL